MKKIIENIVVMIAVGVVLFFGAMIVLPQFDYGLIVIKSGSMEPTIETGGVVIIKRQNVYEVGDVITFRDEENTLVTHRLIEITQEDGKTMYSTKGDNNNAKDIFPAQKEKVRGRMIFKMPFVGYIIVFFQSQMGVLLLILVPAGYFIGREIIKIKKGLKDKKV